MDAWQSILALPASPGTLLCFTHRLLHWGSRAQPGAAPRLAISFALADPTFEVPYFADPATHLPFPPLPLRVALRAAQVLVYK